MSNIKDYSNKDTVECYYHKRSTNSAWCVECGSPICTKCIENLRFWDLKERSPLCKPCSVKILRRHCIAATLIVGGVIPISGFLSFLLPPLLILLFFALFIFGFVNIPYLIRYHSLIKSYKAWSEDADEKSYASTDYREKISNRTLINCDYHDTLPSINRCEKCGKNICIKCHKILPSSRYTPRKILCFQCYWPKYRNEIIFIISILLIFPLSVPIALICLNILSITSFFLYFVPFYLLLIGLPVYYLMKNRLKYIRWKNELGF